MKLAKQYQMDEDAVNNGRDVNFGEGAVITIARANNKEAVEFRAALMKPYDRPGFRTKKISDADEKAISIKVLATKCVRRWKGVSLEGLEWLVAKHNLAVDSLTAPTYTPALGIALFTEFEDFYRDCLLAAVDEDNYRADSLAETAQD